MFWRELDPRTFEWFCLGLSIISSIFESEGRWQLVSGRWQRCCRMECAPSPRHPPVRLRVIFPAPHILCRLCLPLPLSHSFARSQCGAAGGPSNILDQFDAATAGNACIVVLLDQKCAARGTCWFCADQRSCCGSGARIQPKGGGCLPPCVIK